jgi:hypothetical protein
VVDIISLLVFFALIFLAAFVLYVVSGYFPYPARPQGLHNVRGALLIHALWLSALLALLQGVMIAVAHLHWAQALIAGGLAVLAAPPAQQAGARYFKDVPSHLGAMLLTVLGLIALVRVL